MVLSPKESREGLFDVFYNDSGQKIIVLQGLNPKDTFEPPYLQQKIHEYYPFLELFYWALFIVAGVYMSGLYVVLPVLRRFNIFKLCIQRK